jgi:hypothetical protein
MANRGLAALALGLLLAAPACGDTAAGRVAAHLEGEKAECDFLLNLCRAANRAVQFSRDTPLTPRTEVLATRHEREAEMHVQDAVEAGRVLRDKHPGKRLPCFDDPDCAFVKAKLFR